MNILRYLLFACGCSISAGLQLSAVAPPKFATVTSARVPNPVRCMGADTEEKQSGLPLVAYVGYAFLFGQLSPALFVGLARLGLITLPPINTFTAIANNAMDEALRNQEIFPYFCTTYAQGKWNEFFFEYYNSGETTEFLTVAGGVCSQHPGWCEGVDIPLVGGLTY